MKVIINADDFGRSHSLNQAVNESFKLGLITSAGLIVTGKNLQDALDYIYSGDYIEKIHLHLNVSTSRIDGDSDDVPLTEAMRKDPFFCTDGKFTPYKGLPQKLSDVRKWKIVYQELVAQYEKFKEITKGKSNYKHVDFHLWYNLTWPVSIALRLFCKKFKIKSVRLIGLHQMTSRRYRLLSKIGKPLSVKQIPSANIDFFISKRHSFDCYQTIELYCHPNYKDGVFLDDSPSYLKHERQLMLKQIQRLREFDDVEFVSWENYNSSCSPQKT